MHYASGTSAAETVVRDEAGLAWVVNLGCVDLNPHPVLAEDLEHPVELRIDLDPMPGVEWPQIVDVAFVAREVLTDAELSTWPKTSGSRGFHVSRPSTRSGRTPRCGGRRRPWPARWRTARGLATSRWWKEKRQGIFVAPARAGAVSGGPPWVGAVKRRQQNPLPEPPPRLLGSTRRIGYRSWTRRAFRSAKLLLALSLGSSPPL